MSVTHTEWNQETGGLEVAKVFSSQIRGKAVLITGVSPESIGSSTALAIASQSPDLLILASRTQTKLDQVAKSIKDAYPDVRVKTVLLDLLSQKAIKKTAAAVFNITDRLDVLINNAGLMTMTRQLTAEGIEAQFGCNHVGHFLFTSLLHPLLSAAAKSNIAGATRVINLTSLANRLSPIRFHDYSFEGKPIPDDEKPPADMPAAFKGKDGDPYNPYVAYGQSKTANILFSVSLNEKWQKEGVVSYAVHPGSIWTGLSRDLDADGEAAMRKTAPFWKNHDQGAATTLVAAFDPGLNEPEQPQRVLLHNCNFFEATAHATDRSNAERLWALSSELVENEAKL